MKRIHGDIKKRALGLCMLIATLFGSAVAQADVVLDWNVIAVNTAVANKQNPFAQARTAAIVQLAVFESVNAITGEYHPYLQPFRPHIACLAPIFPPVPRPLIQRARTRLRLYRTAKPRPTASPPVKPQLWP